VGLGAVEMGRKDVIQGKEEGLVLDLARQEPQSLTVLRAAVAAFANMSSGSLGPNYATFSALSALYFLHELSTHVALCH